MLQFCYRMFECSLDVNDISQSFCSTFICLRIFFFKVLSFYIWILVEQVKFSMFVRFYIEFFLILSTKQVMRSSLKTSVMMTSNDFVKLWPRVNSARWLNHGHHGGKILLLNRSLLVMMGASLSEKSVQMTLLYQSQRLCQNLSSMKYQKGQNLLSHHSNS